MSKQAPAPVFSNKEFEAAIAARQRRETPSRIGTGINRLTMEEANQRDISDLKIRAARWRTGGRISPEVYQALCQCLDEGRCPQAVYVALVDAAFVKRGELRPRDPAATFRGTVARQEDRIVHWVLGKLAPTQEAQDAPDEADDYYSEEDEADEPS